MRRWPPGCARRAPSFIGKTNMHELAFGISGYNAAFKTGAESGRAQRL